MIHRRQPQRNIVLTGFHACGKTTVGRQVAVRLRRPFIDVPAETERRARLNLHSLTGIGHKPDLGEIEAKLVLDLSHRRGLVLALGPGTLAQRANLDELKVYSLLVFLDTPYEVLWQRIQDHARLEQTTGQLSREGLHDLWTQYRPSYEGCDLHLTGSATEIVHAVRLILHCYFT